MKLELLNVNLYLFSWVKHCIVSKCFGCIVMESKVCEDKCILIDLSRPD